jgi:hypothetical protein
MYLIALAAEGLATWDGADHEARPANRFKEADSCEFDPAFLQAPELSREDRRSTCALCA